jgi:DNA-binding phage protein
MKDKVSVSHDEVMIKKLRKNRAFAAEYLKAAMEDTEESKVLLIALRQVARESLYRALSPRGNPRLSTLFAVTKAMGLTLTVESSHATNH